MLLGYCRVSTAEGQDAGYAAQRRDLIQAGVSEDNIYQERVSAIAKDRPEFSSLMRSIRSGDVLVVSKLDRLCRSTRDAMTILDELEAKGASLRILNMSLDTATPQGRMMVGLISLIAEAELTTLAERRAEGIAARKQKLGAAAYPGRTPTVRRKKDAILALVQSGVHKAQIAKDLNISLGSVYRIIKEDKERQPLSIT